MTERNDLQHDLPHGTRILIIIGMLAIISISIKQAQTTFEWLLFAVFLAVIGTPQVLWLERKRIPYVVAVLLAVAGMAAVLVVVGVVVGASLNRF